MGRTDQEHLRPQKEKLDNMYLREERKIFKNCSALRKRYHLNCIVPDPMDRLDMENWEKDNLFIFSFENNLRIIPINLKWNFKFYTGYYWNKSAIFISQDAK